MSKYILLTDRNVCPKCRTQAVPKSLPALCRACGMQLFKSTDAIKTFVEQTGWREFWVYCGKDYGWKHSTQLDDERPLERDYYKPEKLPDNYGTEEYLQQKVANSRIELNKALKHKKKIGIMHK
jgi:hypothetical protein